MIDCWLIFNLLKPFVDIIVQTYIETLRDNPDEEKKDNGKAEAWAPKDTSMDELKWEDSFVNLFNLKKSQV